MTVPPDTSEPEETTVVVSPTVETPPAEVIVTDNPNDPGEAMDFAERVRALAREEAHRAASENMDALASIIDVRVAEGLSAFTPPEPPVVVVESPEPATPAPVATPEVAAPPAPQEDEAPPQHHRYYRPLGRKGKQ